MIQNLEQMEHTSLKTQVCVVGAGAAGISMALAFDRMGINCVLLEGGGMDFPSADELDLYDARTGEKPYPVAASRLRFFGGSTNHWGGWSRELDDFDFAQKPYFSAPGWPISKDSLKPYYAQAAEVCEMPQFSKAHNGYYQQHLTEGILDWGTGPFTNKFFVFSPPTRFGTRYEKALKQSNHVRVFLHANATSLILDDNRILGIRAQSLNGKQLNIEARQTVLAMGGLENARFLLNNTSPTFTEGVGNQNDWVGRCFMDHPGFRPINLLLPDGLKYKRHAFENQSVMPVISMTKEALLKEQMNNFCIILARKKDDQTLPPDYRGNQWFSGHQQPAGNYHAQVIFEPSPNRESRVTLIDEPDLLGMKKLKLDWRFNNRDFRSVEKMVQLLIRESGMLGMGRIKWVKQFEEQTVRAIGGGMHHGGTTRMSAAPTDGVVDVNCAVHGTEGLFVMGNSVFPHVGFSNPTVTIIALALKLCDHIRSQSG
jgi:choline dehydrogenase-like flavoprotein